MSLRPCQVEPAQIVAEERSCFLGVSEIAAGICERATSEVKRERRPRVPFPVRADLQQIVGVCAGIAAGRK